MILRRLMLVLAALLLPLAAMAQPAELAPDPAIAGAWDLRLDGAAVFRFEIEQAPEGGWQGRWLRPETFNSDGNAFYNIRGGTRTTASMTGLEVAETVELGFDDPRPGAIPDIFSFRLTGPDSAEMVYIGTGLAPYPLVRARAGAAMGPWDAARIYRRAVSVPDDFDLAADAPVRAEEPQPAAQPEAGNGSGGETSEVERPRIDAGFLDGF